MQDYIVNPRGIASQHFEDETIILNLPKGNYYSLKESGQLIWSQLEKNVRSRDMATYLSDYYGITPETASDSLSTFLDQLSNEELIVAAEPGSAIAGGEKAGPSGKPFAAPVLEVYTDMQELLMLDPIHDADPGKGWPYKNND